MTVRTAPKGVLPSKKKFRVKRVHPLTVSSWEQSCRKLAQSQNFIRNIENVKTFVCMDAFGRKFEVLEV